MMRNFLIKCWIFNLFLLPSLLYGKNEIMDFESQFLFSILAIQQCEMNKHKQNSSDHCLHEWSHIQFIERHTKILAPFSCCFAGVKKFPHIEDVYIMTNKWLEWLRTNQDLYPINDWQVIQNPTEDLGTSIPYQDNRSVDLEE